MLRHLIQSVFRNRLSEFLNWMCSLESNPFVVIFSIDPGFDIAKIEFGKTTGLLYVQAIIGNQGSSFLVTYWKDEPAYQANKFLFPARVGIEPSPHWIGLHRDSMAPSQGWSGFFKKHWGKVAWVGWVLAAVFLFVTYVEKARDFQAWVLSTPNMDVSTAPKPTDVLEGTRFEVEFGVRNIAPRGESSVTFRKVKVETTDGNPTEGVILDPLNGVSFSGVKPDVKDVFKVSGKAVKPGDYRITVEGEASAGLFGGTETVSISAEVKVWRPVEIGQRKLGQTREDYCEMEFEFRPGKQFPAGLEFEAVLKRKPGIRFDAVRFPGDPLYDSQFNDTKGAEVASIKWKSRSIEAMTPFHFTLTVDSDQKRTPEEWDRVLKDVQISFSEVVK